jgi:hypothetical protein
MLRPSTSLEALDLVTLEERVAHQEQTHSQPSSVNQAKPLLRPSRQHPVQPQEVQAIQPKAAQLQGQAVHPRMPTPQQQLTIRSHRCSAAPEATLSARCRH